MSNETTTACKPKEFARVLNQKLAQHQLDSNKFAKLLDVHIRTVNNVVIRRQYCFSRNNILKTQKVLKLTVGETNHLLALAGKEELTTEEINSFEHTDCVWHPYREDYAVYQKTMSSHSILKEIFKHISSRKNPLLILSPKAHFQNIQARVLKGFLASQYPQANFLEIVPPSLQNESDYFSSLAEQLNLENFNQVTNNNDFKKLFDDFIKKRQVPTFLLIRHVGNMENSELLARVLRSIIDTLDSKHTFHPIWVAGEKLEMIATRPTDSIFSIGRMIYYKVETADIQMLAYEWQISGIDPFIAGQILELTGGHYISVEFCLDFFEEKNYIPTAKFLKEALLNQPLFNGFVNHQEHLKTFLKQDVINMPTAHLTFFPIIKTLYFDGLLKKVTENQFTWVNPIIREIGTEMMNNIPV